MALLGVFTYENGVFLIAFSDPFWFCVFHANVTGDFTKA